MQLAHRLSAAHPKRSSTLSRRGTTKTDLSSNSRGSSSRYAKRHTVAEVVQHTRASAVGAALSASSRSTSGSSSAETRKRSSKTGRESHKNVQYRLPNGWQSEQKVIRKAASKTRIARDDQDAESTSTSPSSVSESPDPHAEILKLRAALRQNSKSNPVSPSQGTSGGSSAGSLARRLSQLFSGPAAAAATDSAAAALAASSEQMRTTRQMRVVGSASVVIDLTSMERVARHSPVLWQQQLSLAEWFPEFHAHFHLPGSLTSQTVLLKGKDSKRPELYLNKQFCRDVSSGPLHTLPFCAFAVALIASNARTCVPFTGISSWSLTFCFNRAAISIRLCNTQQGKVSAGSRTSRTRRKRGSFISTRLEAGACCCTL
jgi:hypothetical protein